LSWQTLMQIMTRNVSMGFLWLPRQTPPSRRRFSYGKAHITTRHGAFAAVPNTGEVTARLG
jgi:hypothetical protein